MYTVPCIYLFSLSLSLSLSLPLSLCPYPSSPLPPSSGEDKAQDLEKRLSAAKDELLAATMKLRVMIRAFKEIRLLPRAGQISGLFIHTPSAGIMPYLILSPSLSFPIPSSPSFLPLSFLPLSCLPCHLFPSPSPSLSLPFQHMLCGRCLVQESLIRSSVLSCGWMMLTGGSHRKMGSCR